MLVLLQYDIQYVTVANILRLTVCYCMLLYVTVAPTSHLLPLHTYSHFTLTPTSHLLPLHTYSHFNMKAKAKRSSHERLYGEVVDGMKSYFNQVFRAPHHSCMLS